MNLLSSLGRIALLSVLFTSLCLSLPYEGEARKKKKRGRSRGDGVRVALVVGNGSYRYISPLRNPVNDARDLSTTLMRLGFRVETVIDQSRYGMLDGLARFNSMLRGADTALFFYAGHGMQVNGKNYFLPVDFDPRDMSDPVSRVLALDTVQARLESAPCRNLIFLDACRDDPGLKQMSSALGARSAGSSTRGIKFVSSGGLAEARGTVGTFIAYATQPGNVALDGSGYNSPFTTGLMKYLGTPGQDINETMTSVRRHVQMVTGGQQVPWAHSSLVTELVLKREQLRSLPPP